MNTFVRFIFYESADLRRGPERSLPEIEVGTVPDRGERILFKLADDRYVIAKREWVVVGSTLLVELHCVPA